MSRVGQKPIVIPSGVTVTFEGSRATAKGPKGTISRELPPVCRFHQEEGIIRVTRQRDDKYHRSMHGLTRTLLANMVLGVSEGFTKELELSGVGYKAELKGKELVLALGYSHQVVFPVPERIKIEVSSPIKIRVSGIEKDRVGQVAAEIRSLRPPEPYKAKGIRYVGEYVHRKAGKAAVGS